MGFLKCRDRAAGLRNVPPCAQRHRWRAESGEKLDRQKRSRWACSPDFLVEDDFALQPLRRLYLPLIKPTYQPREHCCESDQPRRQDGHSSQKIVNWFVSEALRLLYYRYPTSWLDRTERIEISMLFEMSGLVLANLVD